MSTLVYAGTLIITKCWCGIRHALPQELYDEAHQNGMDTYCPLGHVGVYKNSENEELRRARDRLRARLVHEQDQRRAAERSAAAYRGHLTRLRKRIANGVCPWCKRSFSNVLAHVEHQHPEQLDRAKEATS